MAGRFYKIYVPFEPHSHVTLWILAAGILVSFAVGWTLVALALILLFPDDSDAFSPSSMPERILYGSSLAGGVFASVKWILAYAKFRNRRLMRSTALRTIRLHRLRHSKEAARRLPHRVAEAVLRSTFHTRRSIKKTLRRLSSGTTIFVMNRGESCSDGPQHSFSFEPVPVNEDNDRIEWLTWRHWSYRSNEPASTEQYEQDQQETMQPSTWSRFVRRCRATIGIALIVAMAGSALWRQEAFVIACLAGITLAPVLWRLIVNRTWFIVPGGVVLRDDRIWSGPTRLRMATPEDSPLIADHRTGEAFVMLDGRARKILCPATLPLLLAAWQSTARRPTLEEVETLLTT